MEIYTGEIDILISGEDPWKKIEEGMPFYVPANSKFIIKVYKITNYCCSYIE